MVTTNSLRGHFNKTFKYTDVLGLTSQLPNPILYINQKP